MFYAGLEARNPDGHWAPTYQLDAAAEPPPNARYVELHILDGTTGQPMAARFCVVADGKPYMPPYLNAHGIRFTSIHSKKQQRITMLFGRGTGPIRFPLPAKCSELVVQLSKGFEFLPVRQIIPIQTQQTEATVVLPRWIDLGSKGWHSADVHLHYERLNPDWAPDWFALFDADGLTYGFFMALKGGNLPGLWAQQYAYGTAGTQALADRLLVPGQEFRGTAEGHHNLLGLDTLIEPVSVGGLGSPPHPFNWPSSYDVLRQSAASGGVGGPAHGGTFGDLSTVYLDAILGASQFVEVANTHLYELEPWYRLLNCGVLLPPVAGTDLPNYPYRESWQPFFGETRTYVQTGDLPDFTSWKRALQAGRVFITSGPMIQLRVNGKHPGQTIHLPAQGDTIFIHAELSSAQALSRFEIIHNGQALKIRPTRTCDAQGVSRWTIEHTAYISTSCWLAAQGMGVPKAQIRIHTGKRQSTLAHTAAIPIIVGNTPIRVAKDLAAVRKKLAEQRNAYAKKGRFPDDQARQYMLNLFDQALAKVPPNP